MLRSPRLLPFLAVLSLAAACGDDAPPANTPVCGNGTVEAGEACDDGNTAGGDGCRADCSGLESCGDGTLDPGEACDEGSLNSDTAADACRADCTRAACGDGVKDSGEECDQGSANGSAPDACRADCKLAACGDGVKDSAEECDEGTANSDAEPGACRTNCKLAACGDGVKDSAEECDEGAANSDTEPDACRASCKLAACGDGVKDSGETCDQGEENSDTVPGACRTSCALATCGDGVVDEGEQCDRGQQNSDSAPNACRTTCVSAFCGDEVVDSGETCDQGQANSDTAADACRTTCVPASCGDGVKDGDEACDHGTQNSDTNPNACRTNCSLSTCGDGVVDTGETCDDGNQNSDTAPNACRTTCLPASCGDGAVDEGEICDQGAANSDVVPDACRADCTAPRCGDSVVDGNESCDDGNAAATDGCTEICAVEDGYACPTPGQDCRPIVCGDGFTDAPETCDDANTAGADGCSATCAAEPAGWTCTYPFDLNAAAQADGTFVWNGDTTDLGADLDLSCANSGSNPDGIARFVAPANGRYALSLSGDFDATFAVWKGVCPALRLDELGCVDDASTGSTEKLGLQLEQGQVIFVVVDGDGSGGLSRGPFVLMVSPISCGDGVLAGAEQCDDGNLAHGDGCSSICTVEAGWACPTAGLPCHEIVCGNGLLDPGETCDDADAEAGDGCGASCLVEAGWACPTAGQACHQIVCGDSLVDAPETCDDGGTIPLDGCDDDCLLEAGFGCPTAGQPCVPLCGNGIWDAGEGCDDGGTADGDGCSASCTVEPGFGCAGTQCHPIACGDGFVDMPEGCDDGNDLDDDGCSATCALEIADPLASVTYYGSLDSTDRTWNRVGEGCGLSSGSTGRTVDWFHIVNASPTAQTITLTAAWSGDGILYLYNPPYDPAAPTANCLVGDDDYNGTSGSQIASRLLMPGQEMVVVASSYYEDAIGPYSIEIATAQAPVCGDGTVEAPETCDDGGNADGDGCSSGCQIEAGYLCNGITPCHQPSCGDRIVDAPETCDDGNSDDTDGCAAGCVIEIAPISGTITLTGSLDATDTKWTRPGGTSTCSTSTSNTNRYVDGLTIVNHTGADQRIELRATFTNDGYLFVFPSPFNPASQAGCVAANNAVYGAASISNVAIAAGQSLTVVASSYGSNDADGPYSIVVKTVQPTPVCGDGFTDGAERCDDGGTTDGDGCSAACAIEPGYFCPAGANCHQLACGDGHRDSPEGCDDGNLVDGDGCSSTCALELPAQRTSVRLTGSLDATDPTWTRPNATCGSSTGTGRFLDYYTVVNNTAAVQTFTVAADWSGDGFLHVFRTPFDRIAPTTNCIVGNDDDGAGKSRVANQQIQPGEQLVIVASSYSTTAIGFYTLDISTAAVVACGDGLLEGSEKCDDGNTNAGDGCSDTCTLEPGFSCETAGQACGVPVCGDGTVSLGESCEDGNQADADGCSASCLVEIPAQGGDRTIYGSLDATDSKWNRPGTYCSTSSEYKDRYFDAIPIVNDTGAAQIINVSAYFPSSGFLFVYPRPFSPLDRTSCRVAAGYSSPASLTSIPLAAGEAITLVVSADYANDAQGAYAVKITTVRPQVCGDGVVSSAEACDDLNTDANDGCSDTCAIEAGFACPTAGQSCHPVVCGDGVVEFPESCEDGNQADGDGCSSACVLEIAPQTASLWRTGSLDSGDRLWSRPSEGSTNGTCSTSSTYGDRYWEAITVVNPTNAFQEINLRTAFLARGFVFAFPAPFDPTNRTACAAADEGYSGSAEILKVPMQPGEQVTIVVSSYGSKEEAAWQLQIETVHQPVCGDGLLEGAEQCDDGDLTAGDGCSDACAIELGYACDLPGQDCRLIICGDGIVDSPEACDDHNTGGGDGCAADCSVVEAGYACPIPGLACEIACGNGTIDPGETCDDGNPTDGDGCSANCELEIAPRDSSIQVTGEIAATDPTFARPDEDCTGSGGGQAYDVYEIVNATGWDQRVTVTAAWGGDGYLFLYDVPFDPAQPDIFCIVGNDDFSGTSDSQVIGFLEAGRSLAIVATRYGTSATFSYTLTITSSARPDK